MCRAAVGNLGECRPISFHRARYQMIHRSFPSVQKKLVLLMLAALMTPSLVATASDDAAAAKVRGKIIGRIWHTDVSGGRFFAYTGQISDELQLPSSPFTLLLSGGGGMGAELMNGIDQPAGDKQSRVEGTLLFLESAPEAGTPRLISFQSVKDQAAYLQFVKSQSGAKFAGSEVIGENDRHEVRLSLTQVGKIAGSSDDEDEDEGEEGKRRTTMSFSIQFGSSRASDEDSQPSTNSVNMPSTISTFYRYHDGFMFSGQQAAIHTMNLPAAKTLIQNSDEAALDLRAEIDLREVPRLLKQQLWTGLQTKAMTYLQRFDNEKAEDHALRSALGKGRLELLKAAMFDVDKVSFSTLFSKEASQPVRVKLKVEARQGSLLATTLAALNKSPSSLTKLRTEDSPLMLSSTVALPDWIQPVALNFAKSVQAKMTESANDESIAQLLDQVFQPISDTVEKGLLDAVVSMNGDATTGATLVGGIKMLDSESFQTALETLLVIQPISDRYRLSQAKVGNQPVLTLSTTAAFEKGSEPIPVTIHLAGTEGYLWFAVGGDTALEVLRQHLEKSKSFVTSSSVARPLEVRMKLDQWLGAETGGFSKLPQELLEQAERFFSSLSNQGQSLSMNINGKAQKLNAKNEFKSYSTVVLGEEGSDFQLKVQADGRQLNVDVEAGRQVVKFLVAQYVVAQNRMFQNIKFELPDMSKLEGADGEGNRVQTIRIGK